MSVSAQDKVEIQELSARYANAMDDEDINAWMETWTADGVWEGGIGKFEGAQKLREVLPTLGERIRNKRHVMTNFVIEGNGNEASQRCYLLVIDRARQSPPFTAVYQDRLLKIDGRWLFSSRRVKID